MKMTLSVEEAAEEHARETGCSAGQLTPALEVILSQTKMGWSARKIAETMENCFPGTPYTEMKRVSRAQRDLGFW